MKMFTEPSVEVIKFAVEDVITVSGEDTPAVPGLQMIPPCRG